MAEEWWKDFRSKLEPFLRESTSGNATEFYDGGQRNPDFEVEVITTLRDNKANLRTINNILLAVVEDRMRKKEEESQGFFVRVFTSPLLHGALMGGWGVLTVIAVTYFASLIWR